MRLDWEFPDVGQEHVANWTVYRNGKWWKTIRRDQNYIFDHNSWEDEIAVYSVRPRSAPVNSRAVYGTETAIATPLVEAAVRRLTRPTDVPGGSTSQSQQLAYQANLANDIAEAEHSEAATASIQLAAAGVAFVAAPNPITLAALVALGTVAFLEAGEADQAKKVADQKRAEYDRCMASSCGQDGRSDRDEPLDPGDYHDATLDQIPGQPTQVSAD